ncbi:MAG TPA: hypothetical protein V6C72_18525 [Chroococcales cyanobacterium]
MRSHWLLLLCLCVISGVGSTAPGASAQSAAQSFSQEMQQPQPAQSQATLSEPEVPSFDAGTAPGGTANGGTAAGNPSPMLRGQAESEMQLAPANPPAQYGGMAVQGVRTAVPNQYPSSYRPINLYASQAAPAFAAPTPLNTQSRGPISGRAQVDARGTPVLPIWKSQPDEVIGHFRIEIGGIKIKEVNGPISRQIDFHKDEKWRGNRHRPCFIWLTPVMDGSGGYFFHCMESPYGPRGWLYPIARRGKEDKVTPWAIFFDQP